MGVKFCSEELDWQPTHGIYPWSYSDEPFDIVCKEYVSTGLWRYLTPYYYKNGLKYKQTSLN